MSQDQQRHQHLSLKLIFRKGVQSGINTYLVIFQGYQNTNRHQFHSFKPHFCCSEKTSKERSENSSYAMRALMS